MIDDEVKIRCLHCTKLFSDRAHRVRDGYQVNCGCCNRLLTFNRDTEDPHLRRSLKAAREIRDALEPEARVRRAASQA
jgi:predicted  nucleic acid-binding Zn-ribbon protein